MSFILQLSYHSHFEARSWEWLFKRRLGTKIGVCSCTVCSCTVHSLLILCTKRCAALHNLCSSCFEFCFAHPTLTLLSADHAQTTSDHVCTLHCSSYHGSAESWSCSKTALLYATSAHHTSKFAMIILPLLC